ncbi:MAG: glycoside hydrolase family 47 protein [Bacteroidota bacterium]
MPKMKALLPVISFIFCSHLSLSQTGPFTKKMKKEMAQKVVNACRHAWNGYKQYAWGFDDLRPLTKDGRNWYKQSLLMSPVDAYDTFIMLGMTKEAAEAKELILSKLNFDTDNDVQLFEITIRLLAALQTAYELDGDKRFLSLAEDLAKRLMPAFNTPTGMPYRYVHLQTGKTRDGLNNPAEIGTLMMEFGKLSRLTGNNSYYDAAKKAIMTVYEKRSAIGLVGEVIDVSTGKWTRTRSHISGMIDSYYEYLYKSWLLFGDQDFKKAWDEHAAAINKYLVRKQDNGWFMAHVDMNSGKEISTTYGALDAFYAGLVAYAGDVATAKEMQKANYYMWTKFGIEPEVFDFKKDSVLYASYVLRPENLESCFYLYRLTGDDSYLWMGKRMVDDIVTYCKAEAGFASLKNVLTKEKSNGMESFLFGETFKYAYLLFAPRKAINLDKVVLTTEAHPFKIEKQ